MKGVLLINLGTPASPRRRDVWRYLTEFLNDPRVFDIPPLKRFFLVNAIIIPFRTSHTAKLYRTVWTEEGSPLLVHGNALKRSLQEALGEGYSVELGMRYGSPSIASALEKLKHCKALVVLPLFPQFASSSSGSAAAEVLRLVRRREVLSEMHFITQFCDHPAFIRAWGEVAQRHQPEKYGHVLFSYHGLPERQVQKAHGGGTCDAYRCTSQFGDSNPYCYRAACYATSRLIAQKLGIPSDRFTTCFQSRLGKEPWLRPYTVETVREKARDGVKELLVFSPSFVADCLETIHEIGREMREVFLSNGGEKFQWVESLNEHPAWVEALKEMINVCRREDDSARLGSTSYFSDQQGE